MAGEAQAQAWEKVIESNDIVVERRMAVGSKFYEVRTMSHSPLTPAEVFATIWNHHEYSQFVPYLKKIEFVRDGDAERVLYEQIEMPLVSDRDYTVHLRREIDVPHQLYQVFFQSANQLDPKPASDHVRVDNIRGGWTVEPGDEGGSDVTYQVYSEPGGSLPTWIVNGAQKEAAPKFVRAMLKRALDKRK